MNKILAVFGYLIALISIFFVLAAISDLVSGTSKTSTGILLGLLVFFLGTAVGGVSLALTIRKKNKRESERQKEDDVIKAIISHDGSITPFELAADTSFTIDECNEILELLCRKGYGSVFVTDQGNIVYSFKSFLSDKERASARDFLHE